MKTNEKLKLLKEKIKYLDKLTVAYSGGVDSTFLLKAACEVLDDNAFAVIARSAAFPEREFKEAIDFIEKLGVKHQVLLFDEFSVAGFAENSPDRCYFCKRELFEKIKQISRGKGIDHVADGSNLDDLKDYRPGMKAVKELGIISPLQDAEMTKEDIRILSREMGLPTWNKPSFACLASRFPFGDRITKEKLQMVDTAECYLMGLGFKQVRVRCHTNLARIEVTAEDRNKLFNLDLMDRIDRELKRMGFSFVSLDLQGYRTGSMNPSPNL